MGMRWVALLLGFFFFNDTATTEIYTLSLHDALPISVAASGRSDMEPAADAPDTRPATQDRKSTRLNSSHSQISYAVFCLKKKRPDVGFPGPTQQVPLHPQS